MATGKTSASTKKSTAKAHSAHKSSQGKAAQAKTSQAKSAPSKRGTAAAPRASAAKPVIKSATTSSKTAHRRTSATSKKTATVVTRRSTQQQPTAERYQEIQQALADRGYFHATADGIWGADSVEALKRFQRGQNIADDGKLGSLSLIALGLGPKRVARIESPEKPTQQP